MHDAGVPTREERLKRNLAIAETFFDGYHNSVRRGRLEKVFMPEHFAREWDFCSPFLGGQTRQSEGWELGSGAALTHQTIWRKIPDYKMDDFKAWPTERGCAWRWRVNGQGVDGRAYEFWEQLFVWTDDEAKITRFEFYDDWHGFAQTLAFAYETTLDGFTRIEGYGAPPWTPGPSMEVDPALPPPRLDPPADGSVARNLALARRFYEGEVSPADFAEDWVLFSPWFGEKRPPAGWDWAAVIDTAQAKARRRLPDYAADTFEAWPTQDGCAWRWRLHGHAPDGTHYAFWEQLFMQTGEDGRITRLEVFDDWQGFPQTVGFITGLNLDQLWDAERFAAWIAAPTP